MSGDYKDTNPLANVTIAGWPGMLKGLSLSQDGAECYTAAVGVAFDGDALYLTGLANATEGGAWNGDLKMVLS